MVSIPVEGWRTLLGLYFVVYFVTGGGMEMLARSTFPPIVPVSAKRLLRLGTEEFEGMESNECEGVRPVVGNKRSGLETSCAGGEGGSLMSTFSGTDVALPKLYVLGNEAILNERPRQQPPQQPTTRMWWDVLSQESLC